MAELCPNGAIDLALASEKFIPGADTMIFQTAEGELVTRDGEIVAGMIQRYNPNGTPVNNPALSIGKVLFGRLPGSFKRDETGETT